MLNPILFTERVVQDFLSYQLTAYPFADKNLYAAIRSQESPIQQGCCEV